MRKHIGFVLAFALLGLGLEMPHTSAAVSTFDAPKGSAALFDGADEHFLTFTNSAYIHMSDADFTISWWQRTTSNQFLYPRIMQFGAGHNYTDSFAISEENDGNIYLWINGLNITSMPIPGPFDWHHIALTRTGDTFRWFLNGSFISETIFTPVIPCDGCLPKFAFFTTNTLNLLIGGGDDPITGAFIGSIAGFQISQTVRWAGTNSFTPPTNFQNPESSLVFSMYGDQTEITDRSQNLLSVTNPGITVTDFDPPVTQPTPDPSPSPSDSPSPTPDPSPSPSDSPSPTPDPSPSPSDSPSPTPDPSPSPSDSPSPTPDPDLPRYEVSVSVWRAQGGKITYQTESDTEYSNVPDTSYEFWVEGPESLQINLIPARGYAVDFIIWNGEKISDPTRWNNSANFIDYDSLIGNITIRVHFKLVRIVSTIEALTENEFPYFDQDIFIRSPDPDNPNNYWGVDGIVMSIPVSVMEPTGQKRSITCFMNIDPFWYSNSSMSYSEIEITLLNFGRFVHEFFPNDCETTRSEAFPEGEEIPNYLPGMFGQESVTVTFSLFSNVPDDITNLSPALETLTVTLGLPPDILSHSITSFDPAKSQSNAIYFSDTLTVSVSHSINEGFALMGISLPEATSLSETDAPTICFISFPINEYNSYRFPSEEEFMNTCRLQWDGVWELDRSADHFFGFFYSDVRENIGFPLSLTIPALEVPAPTPPAPTPPAPTPPAPTPPTPTPPVSEPPAIVEKFVVAEPILETSTVLVEPEVVAITEQGTPEIEVQEVLSLTGVKTPEKEIITIGKKCVAAGIWVYTKSGRLQICDSNMKTVLDVKACTGKSSTPTYPWIFRAYRFKPGYLTAQSGLKMYYSVFFYKGLSITGVEKVASQPCSNGSVFIEKKYAKTVYQYALKQKPIIWVRDK